EYILASSGEKINEDLRSGTNDHKEILEVFDKYKVKEDITTYRTVSPRIYKLMDKNAKNLNGVDLFELGILHTSLIKGYESREEGYKLRVKVKKGTPAFYVGNLTGEESHYYEVIVVNNLKLKIVNMSFDSLLGALKTGKIDIIISGMTSTPERKKQVDFSDSYMMTKNIMLVKKDKVNEYKDIKDFNNKKVGAQKGTEQEKIAQTEIENASITSLSRLPDVILALKSG
ncbi:transporter substrate-binding domain-containing protein, partial [Acinetobacter baumannii]|nr:transporter substrate-binding domain-containing protein [Acinetobacter baumannii]